MAKPAQKPANSKPATVPTAQPPVTKHSAARDTEDTDYEPIDEELHEASNGVYSAQPMVAPTQLHQPTMI